MSLWCWGNDFLGQLDSGGSSTPTPVKVPAVSSTMVAAGRYHSCAILADGQAWCWGGNMFGQLGDGSTMASASPKQAPNSSKASQVATGDFLTCTRYADASLWCWGDDSAGHAGAPPALDQPIPQRIVLACGK